MRIREKVPQSCVTMLMVTHSAFLFRDPSPIQDAELLRVQPAHPEPPGGPGVAGGKRRRRPAQGADGKREFCFMSMGDVSLSHFCSYPTRARRISLYVQGYISFELLTLNFFAQSNCARASLLGEMHECTLRAVST